MATHRSQCRPLVSRGEFFIRRRSLSPATSIALSYALLAGLWILLSDWFLAAVVGTETDRQLHILKGWSFVLVTSGLLWVVLQRYWSARLEAERAGAESERRLADLLGALSAVLFGVRGEAPYPIASASSNVAERLGYELGELVAPRARSVLDLFHPQDRPRIIEALETAAEGEETFVLELRWLQRSGETRWTWCKGRRDEHSGDFELLVVDVSRVKQLEAQIIEAHALESLAELAAGVAHDLNNFLTAIIGHAELGETVPCFEAGAGDHARRFGAVLAAAGDARVLNQRLLGLGRTTPERREPVDLNRLVEAVAVLLMPMVRRRIDLVTQCHPDPVRVIADARQVERVLVNLAVNARDALPDGGELRIATQCLDADPVAEASLAHVPAGRYGCLVVADTGVGIAPEHREKIFEPFFTTKPPDQGTGLGLAVVAGLIEQQGGHIAVDSTLGAGTTFRVLFPLATDGGGPLGQSGASSSTNHGTR